MTPSPLGRPGWPGGALLVSALTTIMLGLIVTAVLIYQRRRPLPDPVTRPATEDPRPGPALACTGPDRVPGP